MYSWECATIEDYKPLKSVKGWKKCKNCSSFPRVWSFNNGVYAKCRCTYKYDVHQAMAESVCSYAKRNNGSLLNYDNNEIVRQWNLYVKTNIPQNKLEKGRW